MKRLNSNILIMAAAILFVGVQTRADFFDDFDGLGNIVWTNGTDDVGGDFTFNQLSTIDNTSVAIGTGGIGRKGYAYFELSPDDVAAGYTVTAKGRGLNGDPNELATDQAPTVALHFQSESVWNDQNIVSAQSGGSNHLFCTPDGGVCPGWFGGGGPSENGIWYWVRAVVAPGGSFADLYASPDGVDFTHRQKLGVVPTNFGNKIGLNSAGQASVDTEYDFISVTVNPFGNQRTWNQNQSGDWNDSNNWDGGGFPNGNDRDAILGSIIASPQTVFTNTVVTVRSIEFNSSNTYAVSGTGSITMEAGSRNISLDVGQGSHEFQVPVRLNGNTDVNITEGASLEFVHRLGLNGNTMTKEGGGTLKISNTLNTGGGTVTGVAGTISGGGTISGDLNMIGGILAPGESPVTIAVIGNLDPVVVPEPVSQVLIVLGGIMLLVIRRRYRS